MREQISAQQNEQTTAWVQECIQLSHRKIAALMRNDLAELEQSLEDEERLLALLPSLNVNASVSRSTLAELRSLNERSRALVENGFEFARTMLDAIYPPTTYADLL